MAGTALGRNQATIPMRFYEGSVNLRLTTPLAKSLGVASADTDIEDPVLYMGV